MDGVKGLKDSNYIQGQFPKLNDSEIVFNGENNILYCEESVTLTHSRICFSGSNSLVYLGSNGSDYALNVVLYNDTVFHMGRNNGITAKMTVILSEQRHCFIGDNGIFAVGICIRNADPHLIYDSKTRKRINPSKSVYIGDHVWIGQDSLILKGTQIDSGSVIGGGSVVAGKHIPHNSIWAGNPVRRIRSGTFWDADCVHQWTEERSISSYQYDEYLIEYKNENDCDKWTYEYIQEECQEYDLIDREINSLKKAQDRCEYILNLDSKRNKNRFVHGFENKTV